MDCLFALKALDTKRVSPKILDNALSRRIFFLTSMAVKGYIAKGQSITAHCNVPGNGVRYRSDTKVFYLYT